MLIIGIKTVREGCCMKIKEILKFLVIVICDANWAWSIIDRCWDHSTIGHCICI